LYKSDRHKIVTRYLDGGDFVEFVPEGLPIGVNAIERELLEFGIGDEFFDCLGGVVEVVGFVNGEGALFFIADVLAFGEEFCGDLGVSASGGGLSGFDKNPLFGSGEIAFVDELDAALEHFECFGRFLEI